MLLMKPSTLAMGILWVTRYQGARVPGASVEGTPALPRYSEILVPSILMAIICGKDCEEKQVAARDKVVSLVAHLHNLQHPRFRTYCVLCVCITLIHILMMIIIA